MDAVIPILERARATSLLTKLAKLRSAATDERLLAAEAAARLGDKAAHALVEKLRTRWDRELDES